MTHLHAPAITLLYTGKPRPIVYKLCIGFLLSPRITIAITEGCDILAVLFVATLRSRCGHFTLQLRFLLSFFMAAYSIGQAIRYFCSVVS